MWATGFGCRSGALVAHRWAPAENRGRTGFALRRAGPWAQAAAADACHPAIRRRPRTQDFYGYRLQRPGISRDRGLSRVMRWVVGVGIVVLVACIVLASTGRNVAGEFGAVTFFFGLVLIPVALVIAPLVPRLARWLAMLFAMLGLLIATLGSLTSFLQPLLADLVAGVLVVWYFAVTCVLLVKHWQEQPGPCDRVRPPFHSRFHSSYRRLRADELPVDEVIRRLRMRVHRRRRRSARTV